MNSTSRIDPRMVGEGGLIDLLSFDNTPTTRENRCRLYQVGIFDIEITEFVPESTIQILVKERGAARFNEFHIKTTCTNETWEELQCLMHVLSIGIGPVPVQIVGIKTGTLPKRTRFPMSHRNHLETHPLHFFNVQDDVAQEHRRKYEGTIDMIEHQHTIRTEATFIRNGIMDYRFPALPKKSVTGLPITEHTGNREPAPESEYEYEIDLS